MDTDERRTADNKGFGKIWAEVITMGIGSLLGFGSGRSFSIWLFFLSSFSVTILGSGSGQTIFKYPNFAKPCSLCDILKRYFDN